MTVTEIPVKRHQLQHDPALSLAIQLGVTREDVAAKRLLISGCYEQRPGGMLYHRRVLSLLPPNVSLDRGTTFRTTVEEASADEWTAQYFGRYIGSHRAADSDYFPYRYSITNKAFRCDSPATTGEMLVETYFPMEPYLYDNASSEASRNDQISDADLVQERIAIGDCATGIESWLVWKVRIPPGMNVKVGDYIEAVAGAYEGSAHSTGKLSVAIRKVARPPTTDFIASIGRGDFTAASGNPVPFKVGCGAHAAPLLEEISTTK